MSNNLIEALGGLGGLQQIASELGVDQQTVATGAAALLPHLRPSPVRPDPVRQAE